MDFSWLSASSLSDKRVESARGECGRGGESEHLCKQEEEKEEEKKQQQQQRRNYLSLKNSGMIHGLLPNCDHLVNP